MYNPGSAVTNPAFQPCSQVVGTVSMCCGTNWTSGIVESDTCEPNGLSEQLRGRAVVLVRELHGSDVEESESLVESTD